MATCCTSVLLPAFSFQSRDAEHIKRACQAQFGIQNTQDFQLFSLVPLTQEVLEQQLARNGGQPNFEIGVRLDCPSFSNLTLANVENSMLEKQRCQNLLKSSNEALLTFTNELKRIKKVIVAAVLSPDESMDSTRINSETTGGAGSMRAAANSKPAGTNA